ncbi:cytidine deaminase [Escherichia coli]|jgi:deoxycytidylate deaminase|nr:anti-phage dCTP deaminase [Escherichia coli]EIM2315564.1 cytidine deaminase [Salmonella enterica]EJI5964264.1 cytidine deaminase [Escherichia coli]MDM1625812.1 cytidine deaminase [Escherichia coli]HCS7075589.1 cytidine deaminase [Escherichia coli]HEC3201618.1 cytidine deaminase [Escherichia coli]
MAIALKKEVQKKSGLLDSNSNESPMQTIITRQSPDLFIGLCGFAGCGMKTVNSVLSKVAKSWNYDVVHIRISDLMQDPLYFEKKVIEENDDLNKERHIRLQKLANGLRRHYKKKELLAEAAITYIKSDKVKKENKSVKTKTVYIIDQLKRPEEIELLRIIYQHNFYLIGIVRDPEHTVRNLKEDDSSLEDIYNIINVDDKSDDDFGQRTSKAILDSDVFIKNNQSQKNNLEKKINRFFGLIHGQNGLTPTIAEKGMYSAYAASLQSACLSRQVGAALLDDEGNLLAVGKNDVPKSGGGLYISDDGDNDHRCVYKSGKCYNIATKLKIKKRIADILIDELKNNIGSDSNLDFLFKKISNNIDSIADAVYSKSKISSVMEYSRSIHAEMDVITTMARKSSEGTKGKTLYTTTYPCHNCARHIVSSGMKKVIYIEPFDKSLALDLHDDAITTTEDPSRVIFSKFEGVAPRRYNKFFMPTDERKDEVTGEAYSFNVKYKRHIDVQFLDSYRTYEDIVAQRFLKDVAKVEPKQDDLI